MRARKLLANKNTECPGVLIMHSGTPETGQKSRFFKFFLLWKRKKNYSSVNFCAVEGVPSF